MMRIAVALLATIGCTHGMPRADPRCDTGDPLFQGDDRKGDHDIRVWITTAGAWVYREGVRVERGCLDHAQMGDVLAALARATWTKYYDTCSGSMMAANDDDEGLWCRADHPLRYYVHGQLMLTIACATTDDATAEAIMDLFATISLASA